MNRYFGRVTEDHKLVLAPDILGKSIRTPTARQYHAAGYWETDHPVPTAPEGKIVRGTGLWDLVTVQEEHFPEVDENGEQVDPDDTYKPLIKQCRQRYEIVDKPEPVKVPRVFSKLQLLVALGKRDLYGRFVEYLKESGYEPMWNAAQDLSEDYDGLDEVVAQFKSALYLTDAQVDEILDEAVMR